MKTIRFNIERCYYIDVEDNITEIEDIRKLLEKEIKSDIPSFLKSFFKSLELFCSECESPVYSDREKNMFTCSACYKYWKGRCVDCSKKENDCDCTEKTTPAWEGCLE